MSHAALFKGMSIGRLLGDLCHERVDRGRRRSGAVRSRGLGTGCPAPLLRLPRACDTNATAAPHSPVRADCLADAATAAGDYGGAPE